jgi:excinuclease ABC subunit C
LVSGGGGVIGRRAHRLTFVANTSPSAIVVSFLQQYYLNSRHSIPPLVLINTSLPEESPLPKALSTAHGRKIRFTHPRRGEKLRLVEMAEAQARRLLHEHSVVQAPDAVLQALRDLALLLDLGTPPVRIDAFDISHVQGTNVVAGMVVFCDGVPDRSEYRRFKIRGQHGNNDVASIREAVYRRYSRVKKDHLEPPSLILIDGGKGQLAAAVEALAAAAMPQLSVFALAKEMEQIFRPGESQPLAIPPASPGHLLLRRIRDEVHRYAVTYHRSLRGRASLESQLDQIPGVGTKRRKKLLIRFGSAAAIEAAGFDAVAAVRGIGPALARRILLHLSGREHEV